MANPGHPPLSYGPNTGSGSTPFPQRRSSYAAVVSGTANSATAPSFQQPARAGAFSHLSHANNPPGYTQPHLPATHSRTQSRTMEADGHTNMSESWGKGGSLPSYASQFGHIGNGHGAAGSEAQYPPFFIPSYLRGSRHAERLEEAHNAKMAARRDVRSTQSSNAGSLSTSSSSMNLHKMGPSHRGMTHDVIERAPVFVEAATAPFPTRWSESDKFGGLDILQDGMEVRLGGLGKAHEEAASVRADHPMPRQCGIYYYEVTVVSKGKEGLIGIGFSGRRVNLNRLPGWEPESWAYHGDDGFSFCCTASGKAYGPKFSSLDVIGCGVNFRTNCAFFTKNGVNLGIAFRDIKSEHLYPSVGMKKPGEHLRVNFGQSPFVFDIDGMVENERLLIQKEISKASVTSLQPRLDEAALVHELVAQYLAHDGYVETARAFTEEVRAESLALANGNTAAVKDLTTEEDLDAINRQKIRAAILDGDIDKALKHTTAYYPSVLRDNENIYFKLRCRKFIEMIRKCNELQSGFHQKSAKATNGHMANDYDDGVFDHQMELDDSVPDSGADWEKMDTEDIDINTRYNTLLQETILYGQELRSEFNNDPRREVKKALEDTFALIAYPDARESSVGNLLEVSRRVPVAEELNSAILVSLGKSSSAALERLVQQAEALVDELGEDGGAGAFVNVRRDFLR
ncbi:hypothetical protein H2199_002454 [Coniosporium tulheliwenetii]|uniref:Uncharacterized protein n=1 Tax=Coniosporium tulheliwenetii TaxID=3383036 RepID=A0ACC2ZF46_9PEZI|nr:hypothetical protein H2199_002454 [Cladosporium sp. JES 115]